MLPRRIAYSVAVAVTVAALDVSATGVGEPGGSAGLSLFTDDQATEIWTPHAGAGAVVLDTVAVEADWSADLITSASVDVVTAATTRMEETRHELGTNVRTASPIGGVDLDGGYLYSFETDSESHVAQAGVVSRLLDDHLQLGFRYGASHNSTGLPGEPRSARKSAWIHSAELGAALTLDRRTIGELLWSTFLLDGFQTSPYRLVPVLTSSDLRGATWIGERTPGTRWRNAWLARIRRAFGQRWLASVSYRFYLDDWGVTAHTEEATVSWEFLPRWTAELRERGSIQGGADFYEEQYVEEEKYRTRDRRLSPHVSGMAGVVLLWRIATFGTVGVVDARLSFDAVAWKYDEYLAPELSPNGLAELRTLGLVTGTLTQVGLEVRQ